ncbi:MAG: hypothetical protein VX951_13425 [Planctomycetota bacterium]|nr:hypothetical protein [Planctomycetota bacterium]
MDRPRWLLPASWIVAGLALCYGLWFAYDHAWVCDDAFISFRYSKNLVDGLGLVYNAGEYVEGYTNFLWVMLVAGGMSLSVDPVWFGQVLGVVFLVATFGVLAQTARSMGTIPLAAIGFALHEHSLTFSTCGLETSMFTFLVTAGLVQLAGANGPGQVLRGGLLLILATMTRPDGALFYVFGGLVVLAVVLRSRDWRSLAGYALPFVLLYLPYFVWKFDYYGHPFPNTYYAKSGGGSYFEQGYYYLRLYFSCYYYLLPALLIPLVMVLWGGKKGRDEIGIASVRGCWLVLLFTLPYLLYVARVGGDFMFSRFCLPVTPALLLGLQYLCRGGKVWVGMAASVFVLVGSFNTNYPAAALKHGNEGGVVEEAKTYPQWYVDCYRIIGHRLKQLFAETELRVAIDGGQAMLGYFGDFPYVLELNGLTDEFVAHRPLEKRGMVGHEKRLPLEHPYLRERGIHMVVGAYQDAYLAGDRLKDQRRFEFYLEDVPFFGKLESAYARATLITYDVKLLAAVAGVEGIRFPRFPDYLKNYVATLDKRDRQALEADLRAFDQFYFEPNGLRDSPLRQRIAEAIK